MSQAQIWGIVGGGQLGRMSAMAAAQLGIRTHIFCPEPGCPASHVAARTFTTDYNDKKALKSFAESVDVISYEFENIPLDTVRYLKRFVPVYPDERLLEVAQNRVNEKQLLNDIGLETAKWAAPKKLSDIPTLLSDMDRPPVIIKTARFGYDGKGQIFCGVDDDPVACAKTLKSKDIIIEERLDFACEVSVIVARDRLGQYAIYGPMQNDHRGGILSRSTIPAPIPEDTAAKARTLAQTLAEAVDLTGVLAVEFFVMRDGRILANEIAPRPHNSGHWTIDACAASQFEQHARTVCGFNIAPPGRHSDAVMLNILGEDMKDVPKFLEARDACVHLYGKAEARPGRKMGHVTILKPMGEHKESPYEFTDSHAEQRRIGYAD